MRGGNTSFNVTSGTTAKGISKTVKKTESYSPTKRFYVKLQTNMKAFAWPSEKTIHKDKNLVYDTANILLKEFLWTMKCYF